MQSSQNHAFGVNLIRLFVTIFLILVGLVSSNDALAQSPFFLRNEPVTDTEMIKEAYEEAVFAKLTQDNTVEWMDKDGKLRTDIDITKEKDSVFEVYQSIHTKKPIANGTKIEAGLMGNRFKHSKFILIHNSKLNKWDARYRLTDTYEKYLKEVLELSKDRSERIVKVQKYLLDTDREVSNDAYSEFYICDIKDFMKAKKNLDMKQIREGLAPASDDEVGSNSTSRLAINYILIGVCGDEKDIPLLEKRIKSVERRDQLAQDELVKGYLMLKKEAGLDFLKKMVKDTAADPREIGGRFDSIHSALAFHAKSGLFISKEKITPFFHSYLDDPHLALDGLSILTHYKDYSQTDKIMQLYRDAKKDEEKLRIEALIYMYNCPAENSKKYLDEMVKLDPAVSEKAKNEVAERDKFLKMIKAYGYGPKDE